MTTWMLLFLLSYFLLLAMLSSFFSVLLVPVSMYTVLLSLIRMVNTTSHLSLSIWLLLFVFFSHSHINMTSGILVSCFAHQIPKITNFILYFYMITDYVFGNRKFGGNAQSITKGRWVHHTSFLWDYEMMNMFYLKLPKRAPDYRQVC